MSGGLKMLHGDISPSKDNLIFSSNEDLQLPALDLNPSPQKNNVEGSSKLTRNNSLNITKPKGKSIGHRRTHTQDQIQIIPDPEGLFQAKRQQQHNMILIQNQQHQPQKPILRGINYRNETKSVDDEKIEYEIMSEVAEGQTTVLAAEVHHNGGPKVITVDEEIDGRTSCCWGFREKRRLEQVRRRKQDERAAELERLQGLYKLEGDNKRILNLGWEELVQALQKRELSATAVLEAYVAKTLESTTKFNNVTEFIPQAFVWAKELDGLPEPKGPFHGIPFCVKDDTNVEGRDTSLGYVKRLYHPAKENAVLVKSLMDLGAVPYCKTNVPQTLFTYGSDNPAFGTTRNCTNPKLSPGGSSSGTGSLVGSHGCPFGTGSDIGGSLRIPAHFNGAASIKPTVGRLSDKGVVSSLPNLMGLTAVPGLIGQTPTIVSSMFRGICEDFKQHKYDARIPPIPWDNTTFQSKEKLRIGYFTSLPYFPPMGDTEEVVNRAKSSLESLGHTLVPFNMPDAYNYMRVFAALIMADGYSHFFKTLKNETVSPSIQLPYYSSLIPTFIQRMMRPLINCKYLPFLYSKRTGAMFGSAATASQDLWERNGEKKKIIEEMHAEWDRLKVDAVICPLFPFAAPLVNYPGILPVAVCYAMIWNLVDFPAGVVPFGRESGKNLENFDHENDVALKLAVKGVKESIGAPIGVQCVALPYKEEIVLRLLTELEQFSYKN